MSIILFSLRPPATKATNQTSDRVSRLSRSAMISLHKLSTLQNNQIHNNIFTVETVWYIDLFFFFFFTREFNFDSLHSYSVTLVYGTMKKKS